MQDCAATVTISLTRKSLCSVQGVPAVNPFTLNNSFRLLNRFEVKSQKLTFLEQKESKMKRLFTKYTKLLKKLKPDGNHHSVSYTMYNEDHFSWHMVIHSKDFTTTAYGCIVATGTCHAEVYKQIVTKLEEIENGRTA
jgi:hypothetical protein